MADEDPGTTGKVMVPSQTVEYLERIRQRHGLATIDEAAGLAIRTYAKLIGDSIPTTPAT
jgi:hypothetical protein